MRRRAVLVFARPVGLDLSRRGLPGVLHSLLGFRSLVSGNAGADFHLFTSGSVPTLQGVHVHRQRGANFAERLEASIEEIAALGYDEVVAVGRDCPSLTAGDILAAFERLADHQLVLGPDHRGGCYLIGFRSSARRLLRGIRWNQNTDCAALRSCCGDGAYLLAVKYDLDSWADLRFIAQSSDAFGRLAAFVIETIYAVRRVAAPFFDLAAQLVRVRGQMPPPAHLA